jgi:hypothetical protein
MSDMAMRPEKFYTAEQMKDAAEIARREVREQMQQEMDECRTAYSLSRSAYMDGKSDGIKETLRNVKGARTTALRELREASRALSEAIRRAQSAVAALDVVEAKLSNAKA